MCDTKFWWYAIRKGKPKGHGVGVYSPDSSICGGQTCLKCQDDEDVSFGTYYHDQLSYSPRSHQEHVSISLSVVGTDVDIHQ